MAPIDYTPLFELFREKQEHIIQSYLIVRWMNRRIEESVNRDLLKYVFSHYVPWKTTPIHIAVHARRSNMARYWVKVRRLDVNSKDAWGYSPLQTAILANDKYMFKCLMNLRADLVEVIKPLQEAILRHHNEIVRTVVRAGVNIYTVDRFGRSLLANAVHCNNIPIATFLLNMGGSVNDRDEFTRPLISIAVSQGCYTMARMLMDRGADLDIVDKYGLRPLDYALKIKNNPCLDLFFPLARFDAELEKDIEEIIRDVHRAHQQDLGGSLDSRSSSPTIQHTKCELRSAQSSLNSRSSSSLERWFTESESDEDWQEDMIALKDEYKPIKRTRQGSLNSGSSSPEIKQAKYESPPVHKWAVLV